MTEDARRGAGQEAPPSEGEGRESGRRVEPRGDAPDRAGGDHDASGETRSAEGTVYIDAPPERVWKALTDARELERWFPLEARVEPGEGGTIYMSWKNEFAGESAILAWEPPTHLRTNWDWGGQVTDYYLRGEGGGTRLRAVTSGFPMDAKWDAWVEGTRRGWAYELRSLKHYLETHEGRDRKVVYLRRRTPLGMEEAWARLTGPDGLRASWLGGRRFLDEEPAQISAVLPELDDAIMRASIEPHHAMEEDSRDVTLWLSTWRVDDTRLDEIRAELEETLERAFPEGKAL